MSEIKLINEDIKEKAGSEIYYTIMMEQWKTANEMAAQISEQRNNMNNFYMSLMSIIVGGILFSDQIVNTSIVVKTLMFIIIGIIGFICCQKWISQIENYKRLNASKYEVINELEKHLSANVMTYEYLLTEKKLPKGKRKISFSDQEKSIAKLYRLIIILVSIVMLIGSWISWMGENFGWTVL